MRNTARYFELRLALVDCYRFAHVWLAELIQHDDIRPGDQCCAELLDILHFDFDDAVEGADRLTEALTIWALLELYKLGEADWNQTEAFGPIDVFSTRREAA